MTAHALALPLRYKRAVYLVWLSSCFAYSQVAFARRGPCSMLAGIACATIVLSFVVLFNPRRAPWIKMPAPTDGPARSSLEAVSAGACVDESCLHATSARTISDRCVPSAASTVISVAGHYPT